MPQHPSYTPLLAVPGPSQFPGGQYSRFSGMSGLSSSPSNLSSYTAGAASTVPLNDYPSSDHQSDAEKRYSMVPSLMGVNNRASSVSPAMAAPVYMWDEKDPEMDDALHRPDPEGTKHSSFAGWSWRGVINLTAIAVLLAALLLLFLGYPIITEMRNRNAKGPPGTFKSVSLLLLAFSSVCSGLHLLTIIPSIPPSAFSLRSSSAQSRRRQRLRPGPEHPEPTQSHRSRYARRRLLSCRLRRQALQPRLQ
jgi:hypothetical protein